MFDDEQAIGDQMLNGNGGQVLTVRGVRKTFEADQAPVRALRGVDFEMAPGEFVAVMGPSGCGKSTMLNLVAGLDTVDEGEIVLDGDVIHTMGEDDLARMRRRHIGIVFQFFNLIPTLTVLENVSLPVELAGGDRKGHRRAATLLERVGLADRLDTYPDKLSGGEQQRVAIARALVHDPLLVLADEPTGNLDEGTGDLVLRLLLELSRDAGKTLIMATHDPDIAKYADQVLYLEHGKLVSHSEDDGMVR